jgi:hypothetical protein
MEKKRLTPEEKHIEWLKNEIEKDVVELEKEKLKFINQIKNFKKEEIVEKPKKLSLWQKIKLVLGVS